MKKLLVVIMGFSLFQIWPLSQWAFGEVSGQKVAQIERLSPEERERVKKNYREFNGLTPEKKNQLKQRYQEFQKAPPGEREKIRENYRRYENMSPEERRNLENNLRNRGMNK